jgi:hypothetical protein
VSALKEALTWKGSKPPFPLPLQLEHGADKMWVKCVIWLKIVFLLLFLAVSKMGCKGANV